MNRRTLLTAAAAVIALLLVAVDCRLAAQPGNYDELKLPHKLAWGPYTVLVEKESRDEFSPERLRIQDASGKVLREVRDQRVVSVALQEINGGGAPELYVQAFSGGAHCCSLDLYFTRDGGQVKNELLYQGDNYGMVAAKDLDGDGRPEFIAGNDALAYFGGLSYAGSPSLTMIVGWDGKRYADLTRRFPERSRASMRRYQDEFLKALKSRDDFREERLRASAAGCYGAALTIGTGETARQWVLARAPLSTRRWFLRSEKDLRRAVLGAPREKIRVDQSPVIQRKGE